MTTSTAGLGIDNEKAERVSENLSRLVENIYNTMWSTVGSAFTVMGIRFDGTIREYNFEVDEYESYEENEEDEYHEDWSQFIVVRDTKDEYNDIIGSDDGYPFSFYDPREVSVDEGTGQLVKGDIGVCMVINDFTGWKEIMSLRMGFKSIRTYKNGQFVAEINLAEVVA